MKTQKTLILVGLAMSLAVATGCKNNSLSAEDRVKNSPVPAFVGQDAVEKEAVTLEIAAQLKEKADEALSKLKESKDALKAAKADRDEIIAARDAEGNSVVKEILSSQVEAAVAEVQALEKNVEMATELVVAERTILNTALEGLSEEDRAKLGESSDVEFQMGFDEEKARREMALEAQRESTRAAEDKVQELSSRMKVIEEQIEKLEAAGSAIPSQVLENEKRNYAVLMKDIEDASKTLTLEIAKEDNLVKLFNKDFAI